MERSRAGYSVRTASQEPAPFTGFQGLLGLAHFVEAAGDHALNGIVAVGEGVFERLNDFDGVAIGFDPKGDPVMCLFEVFEDEFAASDVVKGEDQCSEGPEQAADAARYAGFEVGTIDGVAAEGPGHCSIGRDKGHVRSETEAFEKGSGIGGAATSGDGDGNAGFLGCTESFRVAGADGLAEGGQKGAVHVNGHQAHGGMHGSSVPGAIPKRVRIAEKEIRGVTKKDPGLKPIHSLALFVGLKPHASE